MPVLPPDCPPRPRGGSLLLVLGDQLDRQSGLLEDLDPATDTVFMAEVPDESVRVRSHRARTVLFLAAMRHYALELVDRGIPVWYLALGRHPHPDLASALRAALQQLQPSSVRGVLPGDYGLKRALEAEAQAAGVPVQWQTDRHFLSTPEAFAAFAQGRKTLRLEYWYRQLRRETGWLMEGSQPVGGRWNFDADNRKAFPPAGPPLLHRPRRFTADAITAEVRIDVAQRLPHLPGSDDVFDWPVTPAQAEQALTDFIDHRLALFGQYQDAMWRGDSVLVHSRLSAALNLKLLHPRAVLHAAVQAFHDGRAPLPAVEGFVRQILGWREYVRGLYWLEMPAYARLNALGAEEPLPAFYWTAQTEFACLADVIGRTLATGYAHHIERLMVTGLFALLLGVRPTEVHEWYLGIYVDAVEWVELPNVLGMSQYADGGRLASKPYIASGRYIDRMSNHCQRCPRRPDLATGPTACPFTTLYWDFLQRHRALLTGHPRLGAQIRHLDARPTAWREDVHHTAAQLRATLRASAWSPDR